jgi:hypothetical protein
MSGARLPLALLATGLAWPYLIVTALTACYALDGFGLMTWDLPDPPWWSAGAFLTMAAGLIPLALGVYGRLPPDEPRPRRLRRCLLRSTAWALVDTPGVALYMALLNVALSLPLA